MCNSGFILLLYCACAFCDNATNSASNHEESYASNNVKKPVEHENVIVISKNKCSGNLALHEGNTWVLVKADFPVDIAKCWHAQEAKTEFSRDNGIAKVTFPQHHTMLIFMENIDSSFAGSWNCLFQAQNNSLSQPVSCSIKIEVRAGTYQSASASLLEIIQSSKQSTDKWMWVGILIGIAITFSVALVAVFIYYKRKVDRCVCDSGNANRSDRPSLAIPEQTDDYERASITSATSDSACVRPWLYPKEDQKL
ncbi:uncharacterized protein LOC125235170 isoform X2 [Leguminivora glycinivorella]|uniref:uncharacterized protein LOC125235170 isoform X2 n=1 Tax=Leguminivora glycinivorella TaxID=1035111 RepID=UPI00200F204B|nr:uncharacterized protein LOC125235170 isoform X2 [Leguminivora glycinivorella]